MTTEFDREDYTATLRRVFKHEEGWLSNSGKISSERTTSGEAYIPPTYPPLVQVGVSNVCNLSCPQCYYPEYSRRPGFSPLFMEVDLYKRVVDEMRQFPPRIVLRFLGRGESLIHPRIMDLIAYAKDQLEGPVALITNGHLLNREKSVALLGTGIDVVDISVDATTADTYSLVRGKNFEELIVNIHEFIALRNKGNFTTKVMLSFLVQPESYREAEEFRKSWEGIADKVIFRKYHSYAGRIQGKPCLPEQRTPCPALWNRISVNERGKITLCYIDWDETSVLADLNDPNTTLLGVWKSAYDEAREGHLTGKFPDLCANCDTGWQAAHWGLSYEKAIEMVTKG